LSSVFVLRRLRASSPLFPYTTLFRSIVFLFLTITVILNDYSTRVNMKADAEANMQQFSNQIAGSVQQHVRLKDALKNDVIVQLRSEEHTSELQSRENLVCRLLLEKKN